MYSFAEILLGKENRDSFRIEGVKGNKEIIQ
jgi:hypothetical protein